MRTQFYLMPINWKPTDPQPLITSLSAEPKKFTIVSYGTLSGLYRAYLEGHPDIQAWNSNQDRAIKAAYELAIGFLRKEQKENG